MSFTLKISCRKCQQDFDRVEVGIGSTHPVCLCANCKYIMHPRKKLLRHGWFCRNCSFRQPPESRIDLYKTPMHAREFQCPNDCGSKLEIENYMHTLYALPNSQFSKFLNRTFTRISHYF